MVERRKGQIQANRQICRTASPPIRTLAFRDCEDRPSPMLDALSGAAQKGAAVHNQLRAGTAQVRTRPLQRSLRRRNICRPVSALGLAAPRRGRQGLISRRGRKMNSGFGIAALIVFFLSLGVPFVGNFITLVALILVSVAAWNRNVIWPIAIASASAVKLFFLSPSWMILMSQEGGYVVWTLLFLALPIGVLLLRRVNAGAEQNTENAQPFWQMPIADSPRSALPKSGDDVSDWDRIADKNDADSLQEYLLRHPEGRFAELARMKLERMVIRPLEPKAHTPSPPVVAEQTPTPEHAPEDRPAPARDRERPSLAVADAPRQYEASSEYSSSFDVEEPARRGLPLAAMIALAAVVVGGLGFGGVYFWRQMQNERSERAAWEAVPADSSAIRRFLAADPGEYRDEAQDALAQLEAQRSRQANEANTVEALQQYLGEFPDGVHSLAARGRLAELQETARLETQFGGHTVWTPPSGVDLQCSGADCLVQQMERTGASQQGVEFTRRIDGEGYMGAFYELGRVDVGVVRLPRRANGNEAYVLLNGGDGVIWVESQFRSVQLDQLSTFRTLRRLYPNATGWPPTSFIGSELTADGGQRFIFGLPITDGCRACTLIANGEVMFDFDSAGVYRGASLVTVSAPTTP